MKRLVLPLTLLLIGPACDDDDGDSGSDTNDSMDSNDSMDATDPMMMSETSSSMEECNSSHECINDVCECTTPGMEGEACTDDEACVDECEVCM